jgi:hypothetical protein
LHKKPQGCGASVASAAGPFSTKKRTGLFTETLNMIHDFKQIQQLVVLQKQG